MAVSPKSVDMNLVRKLIPLDTLVISKVEEVLDKAALQKVPAERMLFKEGDKDKKDGEDEKDDEGKPKDEKEDKGKGDDKEKEKQKPKPQPGQMSPQQIKSLLEAMNNQEQKVQEKMNAEKQKGIKIKTEKDW